MVKIMVAILFSIAFGFSMGYHVTSKAWKKNAREHAVIVYDQQSFKVLNESTYKMLISSLAQLQIIQSKGQDQQE